MQEMTVYGVSFDLVGKQPIVLLRTAEGQTFLPIWIGHPEAAAILMRLNGQEPPRPLTHDLALSIIESLDAEVERVTVTELKESTFYARITLVRNGSEIEIDSRTSDAIAIALRADVKIYADDEVIEESGVQFEGDEPDLELRTPGQPRRGRHGRVPAVPRHRLAGRVRDRPRGRTQLVAQLALRQGEQLGHEPSSPSGESGPSFAAASSSRSRRSRSGSRRSVPRAALSRQSSADEPEPLVDRRRRSRGRSRRSAPGARRSGRARRSHGHRRDQRTPLNSAWSAIEG